MSTFQNATAEPKKLFLDLLMKNADFLGQLLAQSKYPDAISQMLRILTDIYTMAPKEKVDPLYNQLEYWTFVSANFTSRQVQESVKQLKTILQEHFFSELQIGIIPTSTLQAEKDVPSSKPMCASSSRI